MSDAVITLPWPPTELSGHNNKHFWQVRPIINKHRKWAALATLAADASVPDGDADILVSATFYPPDRRTDRVNMPNRLKAYWDGIADALKVNDRRFLPTYNFALPVANPRVVIVIKGDHPELQVAA